MYSSPDCIWFTVANNQQIQHEQEPHRPTGQPGQTSLSDPGIASIASRRVPSGAKAGLVDGYTHIVTDRVHAGWSCHLVTITFTRLAGPRGAVIGRMRDEVQRVYSTFVTRVHREPKRASTDQLPVLIGAMDLPIYKKDRSSAPKVFCNGGLHFHGILMVPPSSRLKEPVVDHFAARVNLYVGQSVQRIDVRPVINGHRRVVDYVLKTVLRESLTYDEAVLVLPRARSEVIAPTPQTLPGSP